MSTTLSQAQSVIGNRPSLSVFLLRAVLHCGPAGVIKGNYSEAPERGQGTYEVAQNGSRRTAFGF